MNRSLMVLNWFWWRYRLLLVGSVCFVILSQIIYWLGVTLQVENLEPWSIMLHFAAFGTFATALTVFSHGAELDLTSGKSSLPRWLQYLPVRNQVLSVVPIVAMLVFFTCAWFPYSLTLLHYESTLSKVSNWDISLTSCLIYFVLLPWIYLCAVGMWVQATSWWPFKFAAFRLVALFGAVYLLLSAVVKFSDIEYDKELYDSWMQAVLTERGWAYIALAIAVFAIGGVSAVLSVSHARQRSTLAESEWTGAFWKKWVSNAKQFLASFTTSVAEEASRFETEPEAIQWRDWRRLGQYPCWAMLLLSLWLLYCDFGMALFPVAFLVCVISGTLMGKNKYWKGYKPFSPFLGTLPVTNETFLRMRYANAFRVSVVCWGIAGLAFLIWFLKLENRAMLQSISVVASNSLGAEFGKLPFGLNILWALLLVSFVATVVAPLPGMVVGLCGRRPIHITYSIVGAFSGVAGLMGLLAISSRITDQLGAPEIIESVQAKNEYIESLFNWFFNCFSVLLVFKILVVIAAIYLQVRRGIFCGRSILKYGSLLAIAFVLLGAAFWFLLREADFQFRWIPLWLAILFPFGSMLLAPVALDWNRHR